ncbi:MAG: apolipoprotein N-acyltransferase [Proteobacteria bacterium]|nr:apolipoprotein N-acyltransferase [Pseudomonadota bacterium]
MPDSEINRSFRSRFSSQSHWGLILASAVLLILAFPYPGIFPLAWIGLIPLLEAISVQTPGRSFRLGWVAGFVFQLGLIYWIVVAMHVYGGISFPVALVPLLLLCAFVALFFGAFAGGIRFISARIGVPFFLSAPFLWVALEYARTFFWFGFPWESLGYSQFRWLNLIQVSEFTGVYGISFLLVLANVAIWDGIRWRRGQVRGRVFASEAGVLFCLAGGCLLFGALRLSELEGTAARGKELRVGLIQGNIEQDLKWQPELQAETVNIYLGLSREAVREGAELLVWPETALTFFYEDDREFRPMIKAMVAEAGVPLLFGSPGMDPPAIPGSDAIDHNSAFLLDASGNESGRYDKVHLVPFSEYTPLPWILGDLVRFMVGLGEFASGRELKTLAWGDQALGVLICYEAIFPDQVRRLVAKGSTFLVNITNDAWFGKTSAPFQHHSMVVFRAVENRVPVARAANTGISSVIGWDGRIGRQTAIFTRGYLVDRIRTIPAGGKTFYTRHGDLFAKVITVLVLVLWLFAGARKEGKGRVPGT